MSSRPPPEHTFQILPYSHFKISIRRKAFKEAQNSFHFPQTSFSLSYQCEIYHSNKWNVMNHYKLNWKVFSKSEEPTEIG